MELVFKQKDNTFASFEQPLATYCRWAMLFSAVCTFEVNMVPCNIFNSPVIYLISPEVLMLCARALLIFSEFSLAVDTSLALCIAFKLLDITLLEGLQ